MFRIITKNLKPNQNPQFLLLCDDRGCRNQINVEFELLPPNDPKHEEQFAKDQTQFYKDAMHDGWQLGLEGQYCRECTALRSMHLADIRRQAREIDQARVKAQKAVERENLVQIVPANVKIPPRR